MSKQDKEEIDKMRRLTDRLFSVNSNQNNSTMYFPEDDDEQDEAAAYLRNKRESKLIKKQNEEYIKMQKEREKVRQME